MAVSAPLLRTVRQIHLYVGVVIAPALLFFAITGALQTAGLHETIRGSNYQPPHWIVVLAQIHKKQTANLPPRRPPSPAAAATTPAAGQEPQRSDARPSPPAQVDNRAPGPPQRKPVPLKAFFLLVSLGLVASTLSGIWMAYTYDRNKRLITLLLVAGTILPVVLLFL